MFGFNKETVRDLEEKIAYLEGDVLRHKSNEEKAREDFKLLKREYAEKNEERDIKERQTKRRSETEKTILDETIANMGRQLRSLGTLVDSKTSLEVRDLELNNRESILETREENAENLAKRVKEARENGEEFAEKKYQSGYSDGLADGLRKAHEITAEDRKNGMQIAALAAASHQPDATKQIAAAIAKDVTKALPSGKKR